MIVWGQNLLRVGGGKNSVQFSWYEYTWFEITQAMSRYARACRCLWSEWVMVWGMKLWGWGIGRALQAVRNNSCLVIFVATPTKGSRLFGDLFRMREPPTEKLYVTWPAVYRHISHGSQWWAHVEFEDYSVRYLDCITTFKGLYCWTCFKSGIHMLYVHFRYMRYLLTHSKMQWNDHTWDCRHHLHV